MLHFSGRDKDGEMRVQFDTVNLVILILVCRVSIIETYSISRRY